MKEQMDTIERVYAQAEDASVETNEPLLEPAKKIEPSQPEFEAGMPLFADPVQTEQPTFEDQLYLATKAAMEAYTIGMEAAAEAALEAFECTMPTVSAANIRAYMAMLDRDLRDSVVSPAEYASLYETARQSLRSCPYGRKRERQESERQR